MKIGFGRQVEISDDCRVLVQNSLGCRDQLQGLGRQFTFKTPSQDWMPGEICKKNLSIIVARTHLVR
jgi:hypothetical protein